MLKEKLHRFTAETHPDIAGDSAAFATLNAGYSTLKEPKPRLQHLMELEWPGQTTGRQEPPARLADLFMEVGGAQQTYNALRKRETSETSPLARALLAPLKLDLIDRFEEALRRLAAEEELLNQELRVLDSNWISERSYTDIASLYQGFSYLSKWSAQMREGLFALNTAL